MGFLLWFCWIFPKHLFLVRPLESCFCTATFIKQDLFPQQSYSLKTKVIKDYITWWKNLYSNENKVLLCYFPNRINVINKDLLSTQRPWETFLMACFLIHASRRMIHSFEYVFPSFPQTGLANRLHGKLHWFVKLTVPEFKMSWWLIRKNRFSKFHS